VQRHHRAPPQPPPCRECVGRERARRGSPRGGVGVEGGGEAHRGTRGVEDGSNGVDDGYDGGGKFQQRVGLV